MPPLVVMFQVCGFGSSLSSLNLVVPQAVPFILTDISSPKLVSNFGIVLINVFPVTSIGTFSMQYGPIVIGEEQLVCADAVIKRSSPPRTIVSNNILAFKPNHLFAGEVKLVSGYNVALRL